MNRDALARTPEPLEHRSGRIRPYSAQLLEWTRGLDAFLIVACLWGVGRTMGLKWQASAMLVACIAALVFVFVAGAHDLYRSWRSDPLIAEQGLVLVCCCITGAITLTVLVVLQPDAGLPKMQAYGWAVATPVALLSWRIAARLTLRQGRLRGHNYRRSAIVGSTRMAVRIAREIEDAPWMGLRFVGCFEDRKPVESRVTHASHLPIRGNIDDLVRAVLDGDVDRVYVALPLRAELRIKDVIDRLSELPATVLFVPDFFMFNMLNARWEHVGSNHAVNVVGSPHLGVSGLTKRAEDILLATLILFVIAIPLALVALAVRLDSPGPVLFRQRRYGLNGKEFEIWKFRTMSVMEDGSAFVQARPGDHRITRLGHVLRRTSLDELPQFINVLRGDMSIVGPRPHPVALDEQHRQLIPQYYFRHKIRPGITGLAQVSGYRGPTDTLDKMRGRIERDIEYIETWSVSLDLRIVLMTIVRGFVHRNAM